MKAVEEKMTTNFTFLLCKLFSSVLCSILRFAKKGKMVVLEILRGERKGKDSVVFYNPETHALYWDYKRVSLVTSKRFPGMKVPWCSDTLRPPCWMLGRSV